MLLELRRLKPDARFLIINRNEHDYIRERLLAGFVPLEMVGATRREPREVPAQMA